MPISPTAAPSARDRTGLVLALLAGAQFVVVIDETVVNVALPSIAADLSMSTADLVWVVNAYLITFGGVLLAAGRLADLMGRRRVFLTGLAVFATASALAGAAGSGPMLIAARAAQGLGAALLSPAALSIITATFTEPAARRKAMSVWGALLGVGATAGVLLGGVIVEWASWHWVFYVNVPICIVVAWGAWRSVPAFPAQRSVRVDYFGVVLVTAAAVVLTYTVSATHTRGWTSPATLLGLAVSACLGSAFLWWQHRTAHPLIPATALSGTPAAVADTLAALAATALFGMFFFVTLWMQVVQGWTPLQAGLAWAPQGVLVAVVSGVAARLMPVVGARALAATGLLLAAVAQLLLLRLGVSGSYSELLPALLVNAVGLGLALVPIAVCAVHGVSEAAHGLASGLLTTGQQLGGAVGLALLVSLAQARFEAAGAGADPATASVAAFHAVFIASAAVLTFASLVALRLPRLRESVDLSTLV